MRIIMHHLSGNINRQPIPKGWEDYLISTSETRDVFEIPYLTFSKKCDSIQDESDEEDLDE